MKRYILCPKTTLYDKNSSTELANIPYHSSTQDPRQLLFSSSDNSSAKLIDNSLQVGPKLVLLDEADASRINIESGDARAFPEETFSLPEPVGYSSLLQKSLSGVPDVKTYNFRVIDAQTGQPIIGARVQAYTNFRSRAGAVGTSDIMGCAVIESPEVEFDRIVVKAPDRSSYWPGYFLGNPSTSVENIVRLQAIELPHLDSIRRIYGGGSSFREIDIRVGIIDSGCSPHPDLDIAGARNTVTGEPRDHVDDLVGHGTFVAGLIGSSVDSIGGMPGVAPGVELRNYRVLGRNASGATNYSIVKAILYAVDDGCDVINLSFGDGPHSPIVEEAITDAKSRGVLVVVAAGNSYGENVSFPAAYRNSIAVSALGVEGDFPELSSDMLEVVRPPISTKDSKEFFGSFSNIGSEVNFVAPGVGVISTLPGGGYGPASGTSVSAPVVTGLVCRIIAGDTSIQAMPRSIIRALAIENELRSACSPRGFGEIYEGSGMPEVRF